jgi:hypothetical protein
MESQEGQDDIVISTASGWPGIVVDLPFPLRLDRENQETNAYNGSRQFVRKKYRRHMITVLSIPVWLN